MTDKEVIEKMPLDSCEDHTCLTCRVGKAFDDSRLLQLRYLTLQSKLLIEIFGAEFVARNEAFLTCEEFVEFMQEIFRMGLVIGTHAGESLKLAELLGELDLKK